MCKEGNLTAELTARLNALNSKGNARLIQSFLENKVIDKNMTVPENCTFQLEQYMDHEAAQEETFWERAKDVIRVGFDFPRKRLYIKD